MRPSVRRASLPLIVAVAAGIVTAPQAARAQPACAFGATLASLLASGGCVLLERMHLSDFSVLSGAGLDPSRVRVGFYGFAPGDDGPRGFGVEFSLAEADAITAPVFGNSPNPNALWLTLRATALAGRRIGQVSAVLDFYNPGVYTLGGAVGWNPYVYSQVGAPDFMVGSTAAIATRGTSDGGAEFGRCLVNYVDVFCVDASVEAPLPAALATTPLHFQMGAGVSRTGTPTTAPSPGASLRSAGFALLLEPSAATVVPEPSTFVLLGGGCLALAAAARRRRA